MGSLERRADDQRQTGPARTEEPARTEDRYGSKPGPGTGERANAARAGLAATPRPVGRTDLTMLLGRTVLEARVQQVCKEYGLHPRSGEAVGSGLSRAYESRTAGVELAADPHGLVTTIFLHFRDDDGFTPFQGEIPGGAGSVPRRTHLWAMLGRPDERDEHGPWDRWVLAGFALHAQFGADGERLDRVILTLPERLPRAA
jgi:hypothetical protein